MYVSRKDIDSRIFTLLASPAVATTDNPSIILFKKSCQYPIAYSTRLQAILTASEYVGYA